MSETRAVLGWRTVWEALRAAGPTTCDGLAAHMGYSKPAIYPHLMGLVRQGFATRERGLRTRFPVAFVYRATDKMPGGSPDATTRRTE